MILKIVDFPAPSAPAMMVIFPLRAEKETPSTALIEPNALKRFLTASMSILLAR